MSEIEIESTEEWKPVVGYDGIYSVSSLGRVRRDAHGAGAVRGKVLKPWAVGSGYLGLSLYKQGESKRHYVHSLVAEAFLGPRPNGMEVAHNNGIKTDNRVDNLRYATRSENQLDGHRYGAFVGGQKLTLDQIQDVFYLLAAGYKQVDIARAFNVSKNHIHEINKGKKWSHLHHLIAERA